MDNIKIVNIIASTRIKGNFDIEKLSTILENTYYDPTSFPGLIYKKKKFTVIMFFSGKISSHGTKSELDAKKTIIDVVKEIKNLNGIIGSDQIEKIKIENVVGSGDFKNEIDIELLISSLRNANYKPEIFPGLIYRPYNNSIVCTLFKSGKINIVGAKKESEIYDTFNYIRKILIDGFFF
jgi:transcription initiation factor TFIID TATA-box-binding protein